MATDCRTENGLKPLANNKIQDIQHHKWETDSNFLFYESYEEGDFEIAYARICMTRSGRSLRDHDWPVRLDL